MRRSQILPTPLPSERRPRRGSHPRRRISGTPCPAGGRYLIRACRHPSRGRPPPPGRPGAPDRRRPSDRHPRSCRKRPHWGRTRVPPPTPWSCRPQAIAEESKGSRSLTPSSRAGSGRAAARPARLVRLQRPEAAGRLLPTQAGVRPGRSTRRPRLGRRQPSSPSGSRTPTWFRVLSRARSPSCRTAHLRPPATGSPRLSAASTRAGPPPGKRKVLARMRKPDPARLTFDADTRPDSFDGTLYVNEEVRRRRVNPG